VSALKLNGDFRGRYESFYSSNSDFTQRNRFRYRARIGVTAIMSDNFEVGLRLGSGDLDSGISTGGIDPLSQNQTFQNNGSKKGVFMDLAYGKWTPLNTEDWSLATTVGKMENPFKFSDMVFDADYTPEGAGVQIGHKLNEQHTAQLIGGAFVLDESGSSTDNPYMLGLQGRVDSTWSSKVSSSVGVAYLSIMNPELLVNGAVPNGNTGNTRNAAGALVYGYTPVVADASATYKLDSFPMYPGAFPITVGGDYLYNSDAPSSGDNYGWSAGLKLGKAGKKNTWEVGYTYKWLGANAWWEELTDSDTGAYYASAPLNSGQGSGYRSGTNMKGHVFKVAYSPASSLTLSVKAYFMELIDDGSGAMTAPIPADTDSNMMRLMLDAQWKF